jgi:hypothetical protein
MSDPTQTERTGDGGSSDGDTQPDDTGARDEPPKQRPSADQAEQNREDEPPA